MQIFANPTDMRPTLTARTHGAAGSNRSRHLAPYPGRDCACRCGDVAPVRPITLCGRLGYMAVVTALRDLQLRRFIASDTAATSSLVKLYNRFVVGVIYSGIGWRSAGAVLFPPDHVL